MPTATRTFRVFVSSTFEDLKAERNALQEKVFPELVKMCAEKGARFQAIDLRWGVREEAGLDHKTMEICLAEIARCQKTGIKPNFIVLLGDRYGWKPLPSRIKKDEFEALLAHVTTAERSLLVFEETRSAANNGWYRLDWNAVPHEYLLMPRDGEHNERSHWEPVETRIGEVLRNAARAAGLPEEALVKYEASATHQEILAGLGEKSEDREHVFAFLRNPNGPKDTELASLIETLRRNLPEGNVFPFSEDNLDGLCRHVSESLSTVIEAEASRFQSRSALEQEKEAHNAFAQDRSKHFVGRDVVREAITEYLGSDDARPLVVHGPSGSGKSAIIARASEDHEGIRRFIGATPEASNGITLLRSLCEEVGERYGQTGTLPATFNELVVLFQDRLKLATIDRPLVLFVDALDQLGAQDPAAAENWLPSKLPPHCHVVSSTVDVPAALASPKLVPVGPFSVKEADQTLELWLRSTKRTLQNVQREKLLGRFQQEGLPLYLKLAFEEARLWRSFDPTDQCVLGDGLAGIIDRLFARLSEPGNHGEVLVSHALGFLTAARYGLTEDEMLDVLAANNAVWADFERTKKHELPQELRTEGAKEKRQLPLIVWSRLYLDLEPYLTERSVPGGTTISVYHRQLTERTARNRSHYAELAVYFAQQSNWRGLQQPNQRRITEFLRQQVSAGLLDDAAATLADLDFVSAKCVAELVLDLQEDYREAIAALPEAQAELREEERRIGELTRWTQTLIECAEQKRTPRQEEVPVSVQPLREDQIVAEMERIKTRPTRLDNVRAFEHFVKGDSHALMLYGKRPGFVVQQAFNSANGGPVADMAAACLGEAPQLLIRHRPEFNPMPAAIRVVFAQNGPTCCVTITTDGYLAISGGWDGGVRVWDLGTGTCVRVLAGHRGRVNSVSVTPDGQRVVSASFHDMRVWDLATGSCLRILEGDHSTSASSDGRWAVSASDKTLRIWNLETGACLRTLSGHKSHVQSLSVTPDGRRAVSGCGDEHSVDRRRWGPLFGENTVRVWDLETGECQWNLVGHESWVSGVAITPDHTRAVSASWDRTLRVWDLETGLCIRTSGLYGSRIEGLSVTPDGRRAVSAGYDGTVGVWELETGGCLRVLHGHSSVVESVSVTPDGRRAVSASADGTLRVWDLESGACQLTPDRHSGVVESVSVTPDGRRAVSGSQGEGTQSASTLKVWDLDTGACVRTLEVSTGLRSVSITPNGRRAVLGTWDKELRVWDLDTGACLQTLEGHSGGIESVSVIQDGRRALSASWDETLRLWNLDTGSCQRVLEWKGTSGYREEVTATVTADGRRALSGSSDGTLRVWDLETGACLGVLGDRGYRIESVGLTQDGRWAISGGSDHVLRVWNLASGVCVHALEGHTDGISSLNVVGEGLAISASWDATLRGWDLNTGECVALVLGHGPWTALAGTVPTALVAATSTGEVTILDFHDIRGRYDVLPAMPVSHPPSSLASRLLDRVMRVTKYWRV